jgi:hypothetical protein
MTRTNPLSYTAFLGQGGVISGSSEWAIRAKSGLSLENKGF